MRDEVTVGMRDEIMVVTIVMQLQSRSCSYIARFEAAAVDRR